MKNLCILIIGLTALAVFSSCGGNGEPEPTTPEYTPQPIEEIKIIEEYDEIEEEEIEPELEEEPEPEPESEPEEIEEIKEPDPPYEYSEEYPEEPEPTDPPRLALEYFTHLFFSLNRILRDEDAFCITLYITSGIFEGDLRTAGEPTPINVRARTLGERMETMVNMDMDGLMGEGFPAMNISVFIATEHDEIVETRVYMGGVELGEQLMAMMGLSLDGLLGMGSMTGLSLNGLLGMGFIQTMPEEIEIDILQDLLYAESITTPEIYETSTATYVTITGFYTRITVGVNHDGYLTSITLDYIGHHSQEDEEQHFTVLRIVFNAFGDEAFDLFSQPAL